MTLTSNRNRNNSKSPSPKDMPRAKAAIPGKDSTQMAMAGLGGSMNLTVETVNAAIAQEWLNFNMVNRTIRKRKLALMVADMKEGRWRPVGDPLRFDTTGALCDGQHRLTALIEVAKLKPDVEFTFIIIRGLDPGDRKVIDTGSNRTPGDQLKIKGYRNHTVLAHAAKWSIFWDNNQFGVDPSARALSHSQIVDYVEAHPRLEECVARVINTWAKGIDMPSGYSSLAYYILSDLDPGAAEDFFERLSAGYNLEKDSALLRLRNKLIDLRRSRTTLEGEEWLSMFFRAWNAHRLNKPLRALPYDRPVAGNPDLREAIPCPQPI